MPTLYRAQTPPKASLVPARPGRRAPSNVPYVTDNLWEWRRPPGMPDRRQAVCVSPSPGIARDSSVQSAPRVYVVKPSSDVVLAQSSYPDAKLHPDVTGPRDRSDHHLPLHRALLDWLPAWVDRDADAKRAIAPLWAPCLSRDEVDRLFQLEPLAGIRERVWNAIGFWHDVERVALDAEWPFPDGEGFFNASSYEVVELGHSDRAGDD